MVPVPSPNVVNVGTYWGAILSATTVLSFTLVVETRRVVGKLPRQVLVIRIWYSLFFAAVSLALLFTFGVALSALATGESVDYLPVVRSILLVAFVFLVTNPIADILLTVNEDMFTIGVRVLPWSPFRRRRRRLRRIVKELLDIRARCARAESTSARMLIEGRELREGHVEVTRVHEEALERVEIARKHSAKHPEKIAFRQELEAVERDLPEMEALFQKTARSLPDDSKTHALIIEARTQADDVVKYLAEVEDQLQEYSSFFLSEKDRAALDERIDKAQEQWRQGRG